MQSRSSRHFALTNNGVRRPWCGNLSEYVPELYA
jgi:hypothetical protein